MYTQRVIPSLVHIHPDNRDGLGCYPTEVHGLLTDVGSSGWSWSEVKAVATEVPQTDTKVEFPEHASRGSTRDGEIC